MKTVLLFILLFATGVYAGMLEFTDDDPVQWIVFTECDPDIDSVQLWFKVNDDIAYTYYGQVLNDSVLSTSLQYIAPDVDEFNRLIPGHYEGQYWYYGLAFILGHGIAPLDTSHIFVSYDISGGCSGRLQID